MFTIMERSISVSYEDITENFKFLNSGLTFSFTFMSVCWTVSHNLSQKMAGFYCLAINVSGNQANFKTFTV